MAAAADIPYVGWGEEMKNAGVFVGGLTSMLACNLLLIGVCSSAPAGPAPMLPAAPAPPPVPPAIVKTLPKPVETLFEPVPLGLFLWGCGSHLCVDPEGALPLPICAPLPKF
jgi:hypothetical protein